MVVAQVRPTLEAVGVKKRLILTLAAVLAVTASPIAADLAFAQGRGRAEDGRGPRGDRGRGGDPGPRYERRGPPEGRSDERRTQEGRGPDRRGSERGEERRRYEGPRYEGRREGPRGDNGPPGLRPGGRLPPEYRAPPVADYPRYRLRPPPSGYSWRRAGDAFVLTDREGRVYDVVPD